MILESIINVFYEFIRVITSPIKIPQFPAEVQQYFDIAIGYINSGIGIISNFVNINYLFTLLGIIVAIDIGLKLYYFVIWIIKKIPFLSME